MAATPESSRAALVAALDGWKQGRTFQDLAGRSPPLYFRDDDLNRGSKLLDYQVEGDGRPLGTGYSYVVSLTVQDKAGARPPARKRVAYTAMTEPNTAVSREDRTP
jgi:hypothetical protein